MPQRGAPHDLVPGPDAREWRVHDDPARDAIRILRRERIAHHVADIMGDKIRFFDLQVVQNAGDIAPCVFLS